MSLVTSSQLSHSPSWALQGRADRQLQCVAAAAAAVKLPHCHIARHGSVLSETKKWIAITHRTGFSSSPGQPATFMAVCGVRHEGSHCSSLLRPVTTAACPRWTLTQDVNFDLNFGTIILICIANASDLCINVSVTVSARQLLQIGNFKQVIAKPGDILDLTSFINVSNNS